MAVAAQSTYSPPTPSASPPAQSTSSAPSPLRTYRKQLLLSDRTVGLVPTMGALHEGHLSLVRQAAAENTDVFVSIYVNPTQFGVHEDLDSYPKTWESDMAMLEALDAELAQDKEAGEWREGKQRGRITAVFAPTTKVMYPTLPPSSEIPGEGSFVTITPLASRLEGASRPKDVQQTVVIKRMVQDFHIDTEVRVGPTKREADGLAMSSRNVYLGERRRKVGVVLSRALMAAEEQWKKGKRGRGDILWQADDVVDQKKLEQDDLPPAKRALFEVDYISLADPDTLEEVEEVDEKRGAILSGAIKMKPLEEPQEGEDCGLGGGAVPVRLIDNIVLKPRS
ncbi:pantoate-beta-alanine ligase [Coniosporium tulheliwenetii]|uniref:Pantoate-beta-alanine ligase n=1 Tax=Coniosporium tulheliwenetii TaxID=3383036 RepID=A0ACC2Z9Q3_9PEZI|nr:pantoate-beta-alanine ligase [Cladosporium sp. JES 115]